jgi:hypothetical protein
VLKNRLFRSASLGVATLVAVGTVSLIGASAASAASLGTLTLSQQTGLDTTAFSVSTSAACPTGDDVQAILSGGDFPADAVAVTKGPTAGYPTNSTGGYVIPLANSLRTLATNYSVTTLDPTNPTEYTIDVQCVPLFGATVDGDFSANLWFTSETAWTATNPSTPVTGTATAVTASPASSATVGTPVTFTATVSPANAAGTVTFFDGTTALNSTAATVADGVATETTSSLGIATHTITATFTPTDPTAFGSSTSPVLSYTVNPAAATQTSTALLVTPGTSAQQFSQVSLAATVSPATATGSVQFFDGTTVLGTVPVAGGAATYNTSTLALGAHSFTAEFTATNPTVYLGSTSAAVPFQITAFTGSSATETITTTVTPGSLVISVPDTQVALPSPVLNSSGSLFTTTGALQTITVTDNRAGNPGWTVSGLASAFSDGTTQINAENLGWTPTGATGSPGQTITEGPVVNPADGVPPSDTGTAGLAASQTLASTAPGFGLGTAHLGANLALNVPTTTTAGTYTATLTLTAI